MIEHLFDQHRFRHSPVLCAPGAPRCPSVG